MAATLVAIGHGLTEVSTPNQNAPPMASSMELSSGHLTVFQQIAHALGDVGAERGFIAHMIPHAVEALPFHFLAVFPQGDQHRGTHEFIVFHVMGVGRLVIIDVFPVDLAGFFLLGELLVEGLAGKLPMRMQVRQRLSPWKLITVTPSGRVVGTVALGAPPVVATQSACQIRPDAQPSPSAHIRKTERSSPWEKH
jgi:hypothetical protein